MTFHSQVYSCTQSLKIETVYKCLRLLQKGQNYYHWYSHYEYNTSSLPSASHRLLLLRNLPESFLKMHVTINIRIRVTAFLKIYNICDYFFKCKSMLDCVYLQQTMSRDSSTCSVFRMNLNSGLPLKATFSIVYSLDTNLPVFYLPERSSLQIISLRHRTAHKAITPWFPILFSDNTCK